MATGYVSGMGIDFSALVGLADCEEEFGVCEVPLEAGFRGCGGRVDGIGDDLLSGFEGDAGFMGHAEAVLFQGVRGEGFSKSCIKVSKETAALEHRNTNHHHL